MYLNKNASFRKKTKVNECPEKALKRKTLRKIIFIIYRPPPTPNSGSNPPPPAPPPI